MARILPALSVGAAIAALLVTTGNPTAAPTQAQQCLAAKEKILGKYESCVWKAHAKSTQTGAALDISLCQSKFDASWTKPNDKYGADCSDASAATVSALFLDHVSEVLAQLQASANCGNGTVDSGESCDGANLGGGTCSGLVYGNTGTVSCSASCTYVTSGCSGCSVFAQDCPVGSDSCHVDGTGGTGCAPPGTTTEGQDCSLDGTCTESNACVDDGVTTSCRQYCRPTVPDCPSGYGCANLQNHDDIGVCIPN
jgi:hypothetical protein